MDNKAVISNRIFLNGDPDFINSLEERLTHKIPPRMRGAVPTVIKNMARVRKNIVSIPVGRTDLIPEGYKIVDKRVTNPVDFPDSDVQLWESQKKVYDELEDNCIINAPVSWGKTFTALLIAKKLGQKTLIIVHTVSLRNQWVKEVEKIFGIKPGIIGSGKFNINSPIVIGNVQSLYKRVEDIRKEFGTLILDEMHHVSSPTFSKLIDTNYARYKIGLSGTVERKDGKHIVFPDYFGSKIFKPPKSNQMVPDVDVISTNIRLLDDMGIPWAKKINYLTFNEEYIFLVTMLAEVYSRKGHKVLVVADRVKFLETCAETLAEKSVLITGGNENTREEKFEEVRNSNKSIIFATQSIFSEGLSEDHLSCLILATPLNNIPLLTQLIGRVQRPVEGKQNPKVVDINLKGRTASKQAKNRLGHYVKEGFKVNFC